MRNITFIVVHCSANSEGSKLRMRDIDRYHRSLGWNGCGYHYVIPTDGTIERGREESMAGAHSKGHNSHSIGVCYVGGLAIDGRTPKDTRTEAQKDALRRWLTAAPICLITEADFVLSSVDVHHHIVWFLLLAAPETWQETNF